MTVAIPIGFEVERQRRSARLAASDDALVQAVRRAEPLATRALYDLLAPSVHAVITRMVGGQCGDRDDLLQITFERVVRSLVQGRFNGDCSLKRWAASVATNAALDYHRLQARERKVLDREARATDIAVEGGPRVDGERSLQARAEIAELANLLATMKPLDAETLVLHDGLGYTIKEVAGVLCRSEEATGSRLARARKALLRRAGKTA
jgi:RNA polymerase sigma factor (sigma-70 family)